MITAIIIATMVPALLAATVITLIPARVLTILGKPLSLIATGLLLTMALTHLFPEAIESSHDIHDVGLTVLITILFLIGLEMYFNTQHHTETCPVCAAKRAPVKNLKLSAIKAPMSINSGNNVINLTALDHKDEEEHHHDNHSPFHHFGHSHDFSLSVSDIERAKEKARQSEHKSSTFKQGLSDGGAAILAGTACHSFCDGIIIASSFVTDMHIGIAVTAAILAHELPQQLSNYILMLSFGMKRLEAYVVNLTALIGSTLGGIIAFNILESADELLPFALAVSGGSFIYVALSDILPRLNKQSASKKVMFYRFCLILVGVLIALSLSLSHHHHH